jgi:hypothetical protein
MEREITTKSAALYFWNNRMLAKCINLLIPVSRSSVLKWNLFMAGDTELL